MKYLTMPLFVLCVMFTSLAHAQLNNPNNLPPCPNPDYTKKSDVGLGGRTELWNNCWGKYHVELSANHNGDVLDGEWRNGLLNGQGNTSYANGEKYVGEFKDGEKNGHGIYTFAQGHGYTGEWLKGKPNGMGRETFADGRQPNEGIFENGNYIRAAKVNLPNQNNNITSNTDRSDIDLRKQSNDFNFKKIDKTKSTNLVDIDFKYNPNKLPPCPKPDYTKTIGYGEYGRTHKWHECWGKYKNDQDDVLFKGWLFEGEWRKGYLWGYGTYIDSDGDKYVGELNASVPQGRGVYTYKKGAQYIGDFKSSMRHGFGTFTISDGTKYEGMFKEDKPNGIGSLTVPQGYTHLGEFQNGLMQGEGKRILTNGMVIEEGIYENGKLIRAAKVNLPNQNNNIATNTDRSDIDRERKQLADDRRRLEDEKRQRQQASSSQRINLQVNHTQPNSDGVFFIDIKTNADTASLLIDGKEEGGKSDGNYTLKRIARAGQSSSFKIVATDIYGNTDTKIINVTRTISEAKATYADLNPTNIKRKSDRDAVAIIIGISDYKNLPKADFANDDARVFYDYAIRALSIKPDNIKLLVDGDASEVGIYKAFKTWLPSKVRSSTDVYVFYSGHGLPTSDGKGLYLLPQLTDRDLISKTAIQMQEVISDIQSTKPKSVTLFLDACYSGQSRTGETLIASARPIAIRQESRIYPENFTVITASQNDQISSSNPDLKHGIFSYYLMRGMEGDADTDKDGKITLGEMQSYLVENVGRQAGMMNRKQEPQLIGDASRVLVGR